MSKNSFFNKQTEQSFVKTTIVSKYFDVWANVIISTQKRYPERKDRRDCPYTLNKRLLSIKQESSEKGNNIEGEFPC